MSKIALITGANRGIGLSLARLYRDRGWSVIATCRSDSNLAAESNMEVVSGVDVAQVDCGAQIARAVGERQIDLLINNAGILNREVLGSINYDSVQQQFDTNALGPLRITEALLPNLSGDAKIMMVTSRMGSIEDNTSGSRYGYRMSKVALNMASVSLAHDLRARGIAVGIVHPGLVGTDMIGGVGDITPDQAAARIADRIEELGLHNSGSFWHSNGEILPW